MLEQWRAPYPRSWRTGYSPMGHLDAQRKRMAPTAPPILSCPPLGLSSSDRHSKLPETSYSPATATATATANKTIQFLVSISAKKSMSITCIYSPRCRHSRWGLECLQSSNSLGHNRALSEKLICGIAVTFGFPGYYITKSGCLRSVDYRSQR